MLVEHSLVNNYFLKIISALNLYNNILMLGLIIYNDYKAIILGTNCICVNIDNGITVITNLYTEISIVDVHRLISCG